MILSEKIMELRKRNGLSQEEFGAEIGVSRQAVSKWEMAQSTPDLNKIMAISEFFGVPTDFLLKDEYDLSFLEKKDPVHESVKESSEDKEDPGSSEKKMIELPEINGYLDMKKKAAKNFVAAIFLFWISPFAGIYFSYRNEALIPAGVVIELIILCISAVILIITLWKLSGYRELFKEGAELAYGVRGVVEENARKFERGFLLGIIIGVISLISFVVPMVAVSAFTDAGEAAMIIAAYIMLLLFAFGSSCIIYVLTINHGYKKVLKIR